MGLLKSLSWKKDKRFKYWTCKIKTQNFPKVLGEYLENVPGNLIFSNQTAYVNGRYLHKGGRLVLSILEITHNIM